MHVVQVGLVALGHDDCDRPRHQRPAQAWCQYLGLAAVSTGVAPVCLSLKGSSVPLIEDLNRLHVQRFGGSPGSDL